MGDLDLIGGKDPPIQQFVIDFYGTTDPFYMIKIFSKLTYIYLDQNLDLYNNKILPKMIWNCG